VNTGPAAVGTIGGHDRHTFAAIGDTTNLGARLSTVAEPGGVVIGPGTHAALAADAGLAVRPLGPVRVKGKREPVAAWAVARATVP